MQQQDDRTVDGPLDGVAIVDGVPPRRGGRAGTSSPSATRLAPINDGVELWEV